MSVPVDPGTALQDGVDTILLAGTTGLHQRFSNVYNMFNAAISSDNLDMTANYTWTGVHTFDAADLRLKGAGSGVASLQNANTSTNRTITFPDATDTLAGIAATQTFSNKTYASPVLTGDANFDSGTLFVDASNNRVGIGTTSPQYDFHLDKSGIAGLAIYGTPTSTGPFTTESSHLYFNARRGTTASPTVVSTDDDLGRITWNGYDGSAYSEFGFICCLASTIAGAGSNRSYLQFSTGGGSFSIGPTGSVSIPSGSQLFFDGDIAGGNSSWRESSGDVLTAKIGGNDALQISAPADGETALLIRRNVGGSYSLVRVSMGAADSMGTGYKGLRVPN